jgi:uncharacterized protein (TIGR03000 family)
MYSVVLMMALGSGVDATACHRSCGGGGGCHGGGYGCRGGGGGCHGGGYGGGYGGCYGGGYGGCYGGGYGGCYGGGYGGGYGGCYGGGYGGCYGGGYGGYGCGGGMIVVPKKPEPAPAPKDKEEVSLSATLVVNLPADAKLTIDDQPTISTSAQRTFQSPALEPDRPYFYTLKAEVMRAGKPVVMEERVQVRAGQRTEVTMTMPTGLVNR